MTRHHGEELQGHRAGFVSRVIADAIDGVVLLGIGCALLLFFGVIAFLVRPGSFTIPAIPTWVEVPVTAGVILGYLGYGWSGPGRTVGKEFTGLRVVDTTGHLLTVRRALVRVALYLVFPAGLLWSMISRRSASVQDLVVRSAVVYDWARRRPEERGSGANGRVPATTVVAELGAPAGVAERRLSAESPPVRPHS